MLTLTLRGLFGGWRKDDAVSLRPAPDLIFRMKSWPRLPEDGRTAEIYRLVSVMSSQPVNRQWLLARCSLTPKQLDKLLNHLVADGALEVIDPARFTGRQATAN